jgi:hypothetical protein
MGTAAVKVSDPARRPSARADPAAKIEHGAVFTKRWVVELVLDLAGYRSDRSLGAMTAIEPACGDGAFLVPIAERLSDACKREGRSLLEALDALHARDLQRKHVQASREAVAGTLTARGWPAAEALQFSERTIRRGDFLLSGPHPRADFVVGNPPYIRLESVPGKRGEAYRRNCRTMAGRADVYVGFFEVGLDTLKEEGVLSFICADRWMRNQYGRHLRELIADRFSMEAVVEMHGVDAFDSEVSAYPAITAIKRGRQGPVVVAETTTAFGPAEAQALARFQTSATVGSARHTDASRAGVLRDWFDGPDSWPCGSPQRLAVLKRLEGRFPVLEDESSGTRVGIGVATGADRVFVTTDAAAVESDRLLPLAMAYDTMEGRLEWSEHHLVNPWRSDGSGLVDLADFPRLRGYFEAHSEQLSGRNVAKRRPHDWFRTIDRVDPTLTGRQKLLFPDIKAAIHPVLDDGRTYPHHNLYFVVSKEWDLEVLGGLLLSRVAQLFIEAYAVRMRGKYLRFQAQYLRRIRVPRAADVGEADRAALRGAFRARDAAEATNIAERLYEIEVPD